MSDLNTKNFWRHTLKQLAIDRVRLAGYLSANMRLVQMVTLLAGDLYKREKPSHHTWVMYVEIQVLRVSIRSQYFIC